MTPATPAHPLPPARWRQDHTGAFATRRDLRQLLVIEHPWQPSRTGKYGQWQTRVASPKAWQPGQPLFVSFYQSDNYSGDWMPDTWTGAQVFVSHRFKQLLVNGQVVWEEDVADEQTAGTKESGTSASRAAPASAIPIAWSRSPQFPGSRWCWPCGWWTR